MINTTEVSKLGVGTYRIASSDEGRVSLHAAIGKGINLVDTSSNYLDSESIIGRLPNDSKNSLFIMSKVGIITPTIASELTNRQLLKCQKTDSDSMCSVDPDVMEAILDISLGRIKRSFIDVYFIHKPENFLSKNSSNFDLLFVALRWLEKQVKKGKIRYYGISSNSLILPDSRARQFLSSVGKNKTKYPNFRFVQFPFNLLEQGALTARMPNNLNLLVWLQENGYVSIANRPLNANHNGSGIRLAEYKIDNRSYEHPDNSQMIGWFEENMKNSELTALLKKNEVANMQQYRYLVKSLESVGYGTTDWSSVNESMRTWLQSLEIMTKIKTNKVSKGIKKQLFGESSRNLQSHLIDYYQSIGISHILVGMRRIEYLDIIGMSKLV